MSGYYRVAHGAGVVPNELSPPDTSYYTQPTPYHLLRNPEPLIPACTRRYLRLAPVPDAGGMSGIGHPMRMETGARMGGVEEDAAPGDGDVVVFCFGLGRGHTGPPPQMTPLTVGCPVLFLHFPLRWFAPPPMGTGTGMGKGHGRASGWGCRLGTRMDGARRRG